MPSNTHPIPPRIQNDFVVHIKSNNRHTTNRSYTDDADASCVPRKVLYPRLSSRMKERRHFSAERIFYRRRGAFEFVAPMAGKAKIVKLRLPSFTTGNNMVHNHWVPGICLRCLTIGAALIICFQQLLTEFRRKVGAHVVLQLVSGRDRMTSPAQQRGSMGLS